MCNNTCVCVCVYTTHVLARDCYRVRYVNSVVRVACASSRWAICSVREESRRWEQRALFHLDRHQGLEEGPRPPGVMRGTGEARSEGGKRISGLEDSLSKRRRAVARQLGAAKREVIYRGEQIASAASSSKRRASRRRARLSSSGNDAFPPFPPSALADLGQ